MEHLIQPIPGPQCCRMQSRWHCSAGKKMSALSRAHVTFTHTIFHAQLCHTHTHTHTYIRTYVHTYVHAYYLFTYFHTQSFTTSFVFPSFPVPATTFEAQYWKKLTCGVIRSFNFCNIFSYVWYWTILSVGFPMSTFPNIIWIKHGRTTPSSIYEGVMQLKRTNNDSFDIWRRHQQMMDMWMTYED